MSFEEQLIQLNHQTTFPMKLRAQGPDAGGFSFQWSQMSSGGNEAFDPAGEFGDTRVNPVIIRASAASAPAHHTGQKPASRRLLTHQRPARVALTGVLPSAAIPGTDHSGRDHVTIGTHTGIFTDQSHVYFLQNITDRSSLPQRAPSRHPAQHVWLQLVRLRRQTDRMSQSP